MPVSNFSAIVNAQKAHYLAATGISYALSSPISQRERLVITDLIYSIRFGRLLTLFLSGYVIQLIKSAIPWGMPFPV